MEFLQESKYHNLCLMIYLLLKKRPKSDGFFIQKRLEGDKPQTNFFDPISKMKLATFSSLHKTKIFKTKNNVTALKSSNDLFGKVAILAKKRSVDMRSPFKYPLVTLPLAQAEMDGTLKKTAKSVLLIKLKEEWLQLKSYHQIII